MKVQISHHAGVSIVVPVWNEEKNIHPLVNRVASVFNGQGIPFELIFIDDFSTDGTVAAIKELKKQYPIRLYLKQGKRGKALSLLQGFSRAGYDYLVMIDADLQYPPEAILPMVKKLEDGADVVVANRARHEEGFLRALSSKIFSAIFVRFLHGIKTDSQSGLKAFKKEMVRFFPVNPSPWAFDLEFLRNAKQAGKSLESIPITFSNRLSGQSKVKVLKVTWELALNSFMLKFKPLPFKKPEQPLAHIRQFSETEKEEYGEGFFDEKKNAKFVHHNNLSLHESSYIVATRKQKFILAGLVAMLILALLLNWHATLLVVLSAVTLLYFADLVLSLVLVYRSFKKSPEIKISQEQLSKIPDEFWPSYTIFCPLYKEWQVVPQFVKAMGEMDYPHNRLQVLLLLEEDDKQTIEKVNQMVLPDFVHTVVVPDSKPKTKPKAMNYGLKMASGEFLVVYDAEDVPEPQQLKKAVLAFSQSSDKTVCAQTKLNFYNPRQNILTRLFTAEYSLWFDLVLTGLQSLNGPIPLGGTSNHFRTKALKQLHGWDAFNVTEDCDLGTRLFKKGFNTVVVDSTTYEEANSKPYNWYRQRSRWIKGYIQTYLVHVRDIKSWRGEGRFKHFFVFQLLVGGRVLSMFINPFMWVITAAYFLARSHVGAFIESFFPPAVLYMGVFSFVFGNFLYLYYYMIGCAKREYFSLIKYALLVPFYWLGMSVSAWKAIVEILYKPHYWAKTVHGLHLQPDVALPASPNVVGEMAPVAASNLQVPLAASVSVISAPKVPVPSLIASSQRSVLSGSSLLLSAFILGNLLNFAFNAFLGRTLSVQQFGVITLFNTLSYIVSIFVSSLYSAVNHKTAFLSGQNQAALSTRFLGSTVKKTVLITGLISFAWLMLAPFLVNYFQVPSMALLVSFTPVVFLAAVAAAYRGFLQGNFFFKAMALAVVIEPLSKLVAAAALSILNLSDWVSLSIPFSVAVAWIAAFWLIKTKAKSLEDKEPLDESDEAPLKFPSRFFGASLLSVLSIAIFLSLDVVMAKHYLSSFEAGEYALLSLVGKMVYFAGSLMLGFVTTFVSRDEGGRKNSHLSFYRIFSVSVLLVGAAFSVLGPLGHLFVPRLLGAKTLPVLPYLSWYALAISLFTLSDIITTFHLARKQYWFSLPPLVSASLMVGGITVFHGNIGQIVQVILSISLFNFFFVATWHVMEHHGRFILRSLVDLFDALHPLPQVSVGNPANVLSGPGPAQQSYGAGFGGKRILIFNWRDTRHKFAGGAETYIHELARRWVKDGNQVTVFCGNDGKSARNEIVDGVRVIRRGGFYFVYVWAFFYYLLQFRGQFDVIIDSQNGIPFFTPLYAREPVYCLLHHVHQKVFYKYLSLPLAFFASVLEKRVAPWAYRNARYITTSPSSRAAMEEIGIGAAGIDIVFPGVDLRALMPGKKAEAPTVLYVGRLKAYKSVDVLIRSFKLVQEKIKTAKLVIAGSGEEDRNLENLVRSLNLTKNVVMRGRVSEKEKTSLLQKAWAFVNPSYIEGWGITTIEANACGVPVVASNVPGLRDSVKNPHTGFLVPYGDEKAMAEKLLLLLTDTEQRNRMSKEAVDWAKKFAWEKSSGKFLGLINGNLQPGQQPAYSPNWQWDEA